MFSYLYADFRILRPTENMSLPSLENDLHASETALRLPIYLVLLRESRLKESEESTVNLPESVNKVVDLDLPCTSVLQGLNSNHLDVGWLTPRAIPD